MARVFAVAIVLLATVPAVTAQNVTRPLVDRPEGSVARAVEWVDAVLTHVPGEEDEPLRRVGGWSAAVVRNLMAEITSIRQLMRDPDANAFRLPEDLDLRGSSEIRYSGRDRRELKATAERVHAQGLTDTDLTARGVLLHTDIAVLTGGTGRTLHYADGRRLEFATDRADHWRATRMLAELIEKKGDRMADLTFWSRATLAWMVATHQWHAPHTEHALDRFGDDADVRFLAGSLHEMLAAPQTQAFVQGGGLPVGFDPRVGSRNSELADAASLFRRALDLNPRHTEARIHYGRVLTLTGRATAAVTELRRAAAETTDVEQRYYVQLFLGAALEAANQAPEARAAYESAAALVPRAQAPRLALSHLAFTTGQRREATVTIEPLLTLPADDDQRHDPWWHYLVSAGRHADELLADARRRLATPRPKP